MYTDHKPLTHALSKKPGAESPQRLRQLDYIQFLTDIRFIEGQDNKTADALSTIENMTVTTTIPYEEVAKAQERDEKL